MTDELPGIWRIPAPEKPPLKVEIVGEPLLARIEAAEVRVAELEAVLTDVNERLTTALMGFSDDLDENAIHSVVVIVRDALKGKENDG